MDDSGVDDNNDNIAKGVGVVDGNDHGDIALAFDVVDGEDAVFEDDDYAMSALTPAAPHAAISSALSPVVGGGGGDVGVGGEEGDEASLDRRGDVGTISTVVVDDDSIAIDPTTMTMTMTMTTEGAQHAMGSLAADERATGGVPAEDGVVVAAQHSESDDRASSSSSSMTMPDAAAAAPAGGTNGMTGEVAGGGGGAASVVFATTATITCTEDDAVIETKDYDLLVARDENNNNSNKLMRMLLRLPNNNDDVEREAQREEKERVAANARKWSEWMVSGRKVWEGDEDTAESSSTPTPSLSAFESSPPGSSSSLPSSLEGGDEGGDIGVSDGAGSDAAVATMATTKITPTPSSTSNDITALDDSEKRPNDNASASLAAVAGLSPPPDIVIGDRAASAAASAGGASLQRNMTTKIGEALFRGIAVKSFAGRVKAMVIRGPPDDRGDNNKSNMMQTKVAASRVREPGRISASDWRANIINLPNSTILRDVRNPVTWVFVWATSWSIVYECLTRLVEYAARGAFAPPTGGGVAGWSWWAGAGAAAATPSEAGWIRLAAWASRRMCLPTLMHSMMVSAMSLLLVFRTNSAYQRFAEGRCVCNLYFGFFELTNPRPLLPPLTPIPCVHNILPGPLRITMNDSLRKIWNDIVDTARDFSRMIKLYEIPIGTSRCRRINNLLASFPYLLRHRIRPSLMTFYRVNDSNVERDPEHSLLLYPDESLRDTDPEVAWLAYDEEETGSSRRNMRELCFVDRRTLPWKLIPEGSLASLSRAQNRPLWVCDRMAKELVVVEDMIPSFTNRERMALIGYVEKLSRSIGACERIHQTSVPLNYARHALRSLTVWLWTLPAVLVKDLGLLTGPAVAVLSWILFGVYEIGSRIEDPFQGTLRLSVYCDAIRRDVLADAIARDTAFILEDEEGKSSVDKRGGDDAIFELESESEEYDGDDVPPKKEKKKPQKSWTFPGL